MDAAFPVVQKAKIKESKKIDKYLDLARELKMLWNMEGGMILIVLNSPKMDQRIGKKTGGIGNQRKN